MQTTELDGGPQRHRKRTSLDYMSQINPVICRTLDEIKSCQRIRYDVYCAEKGWEPVEKFPDRLERDDLDDQAVHVLVKHRATSRAVGCARVLYADSMPKGGTLPSLARSPDFRDVCAGIPGTVRMVELSRFAVPRSSDIPNGATLRDRSAGYVGLALMKGAIRAIAFDDVTHICMTTTIAVKRLLEMFGMRLNDVGIRVEHRGIRAPLYRDIAAMLAEVHETRPDVWRYVTDDGEIWPVDPDSLARERDMLLA